MPKLVTAEEADAFRDDGVLVLHKPVLNAANLCELRKLLVPMVENWASLPPGFAQDLAEGTGAQPGVPEVVYPSRLDPRLRHTKAYRRLRQLSSQLFGGTPVRLHFDHLIAKGPGSPPTAWHQDVAFDPDYDVPLATLWVPLQSTDESNGALVMLPGSHRGPIVEHVPHGPHGLRAAEIDTTGARTCRVDAGAVCIHAPRTLHAAAANTTDATRLAWVLKFVPDERSALVRAVSRRRDDKRISLRVRERVS